MGGNGAQLGSLDEKKSLMRTAHHSRTDGMGADDCLLALLISTAYGNDDHVVGASRSSLMLDSASALIPLLGSSNVDRDD